MESERPKRGEAMEALAQQVLARMPLAEAGAWLGRWLMSEERLLAMWGGIEAGAKSGSWRLL